MSDSNLDRYSAPESTFSTNRTRVNPEAARRRILIVEDEEDIQELLRFNFIRDGYAVETTTSGEDGVRAARSRKFDLVVLDVMLPGIDGFEVCRQIKSDPRSRDTKVIMLTAKGEESDMVAGLELGADDYVPKPFSIRVLSARLKSHLRRPALNDAKNQVIRIRELLMDSGRMEVKVGGSLLQLTITEFRILQHLSQSPGWVFSRGQIVDAICGPSHAVTERSVDVQIVNLRRKLGSFGHYVETVRGVGYRFIPEESESCQSAE